MQRLPLSNITEESESQYNRTPQDATFLQCQFQTAFRTQEFINQHPTQYFPQHSMQSVRRDSRSPLSPQSPLMQSQSGEWYNCSDYYTQAEQAHDTAPQISDQRAYYAGVASEHQAMMLHPQQLQQQQQHDGSPRSLSPLSPTVMCHDPYSTTQSARHSPLSQELPPSAYTDVQQHTGNQSPFASAMMSGDSITPMVEEQVFEEHEAPAAYTPNVENPVRQRRGDEHRKRRSPEKKGKASKHQSTEHRVHSREPPARHLVEIELVRGRLVTCGALVAPAVGEYIIVEGDRGIDLGKVIDVVERPASEVHEPPAMIRVAEAAEVSRVNQLEADGAGALEKCQAAVLEHKLSMKVVDAFFQFDLQKLTFVYESDERIDFRGLLRALYTEYRCRIWMHRVDKNE